MIKTLCGRCAHRLEEAYELVRVAGGRDNKVSCDECRRRRYGAAYQIKLKKK